MPTPRIEHPHHETTDERTPVRFPRRRRTLTALATTTAVLALPSAAGAFGTIDGFMGQHAEHEKITRVLACGAADGVTPCFQPLSIDQLAGKKGILGGVGIPDNPAEILDHPEAHCDDGDYLPGDPYKPEDAGRARGAIAACVEHFNRRIEEALTAAAALVDANGAVVAKEANMAFDCDFALTAVGLFAGNAKCRVFNGLGRALHTAEDFWSHSNWADQADPGRPVVFAAPPAAGDDLADDAETAPAVRAFNIANPAGLQRTEVVPFLRYPVPSGLVPSLEEELAGTAPISGCDDSPQNILDWANKVRKVFGASAIKLCPDRVGHSHLNKDKGLIDWRTGQTSSPEEGSPRALVADNFQRAVTGARGQARAVWADFQTALKARYGVDRGERIVAALTSDTPWTTCAQSGSGKFALSAPNGGDSRAIRSVDATVDNRTGETLTCDAAVLSSGEWASLPPNTVASGAQGRFRVESQVVGGGGGGPEGSAVLAIGQSGYGVKVNWDNPIVGSNRMSCQIVRDGAPIGGSPYRCAVQGGSGNSSRPTYLVTR